MLKCGTMLLAGALAGLGATANAAVIVSLGATEPSANVEASLTNSTNTPTGFSWRNLPTSKRDLGQSFLATSAFTMDVMSFKLSGNIQTGSPGADFTIELFESTTQSSIGSSISTQSATFPNFTGGSGDWLSFDIDDIAVTSGKYYTFVLAWDSPATSRSINLSVVTGSEYAGGNVWEDTGSGLNASNLDVFFIVQSVVPEPGSLALCGTGGLLIFRRKR